MKGSHHQRRPHRAGSDAVHADALLDQVLRQALGESDDRSLGGGVVEDGGARMVPMRGTCSPRRSLASPHGPRDASYEIVAPGAPNDEAVRRARDAWTPFPSEARREWQRQED